MVHSFTGLKVKNTLERDRMKKILGVLLALIVLIGCTPYHDTKVQIDLDSDLSGVLQVTGSISKSNTEESLESVQTIITDVIKDIDKYEGTVTSTINNDKLTFEYKEDFGDLEDLNSAIKRLFNEDVDVSETVDDQLFKQVRTIDGLKFSSEAFMDEIYDAVEKDELFGEDSDRLRSHQRSGSMMIFFDDMEYYSSETLEVIEYKKIENDVLTIFVENDEHVTTTNVITVSDAIDMNALKTHYEQQFESLVSLEASLNITADANTLTVTIENMAENQVEAFQAEVFGRYLIYSHHTMMENDKPTGEIRVAIMNEGHLNTMSSNVEAYETYVDMSNYKINAIDGYETVEESHFMINDNVITLEDGETITFVVEENNPLKLVFTILKYVGIFLLVIAAAVAAMFGFKKVKKANENREKQSKDEDSTEDTKVSSTDSGEEHKSSVRDPLNGNALKLVSFDKTKLPNIKELITHKDSLTYAAIMFGVFTVISLIVTFIVKAIIDSGVSQLISMPISPTEQVSSFKLLRVVMNFVSSGGVKLTMKVVDMGLGFGSLSDTFMFASYMIVFMILIGVMTYFMYKKLFKEEFKDSFDYALVGTLIFVAVVALLAMIPVSLMNVMGSNISMAGSVLRVVLYTLPTALITTYVMYTAKHHLNSKFMTVSQFVMDAISRSVLVIVVVAVGTFLFVLVQEKSMLVIFSNLIGFASALLSGISMVGQFNDLSTVGLMNFDQFMPMMIVFYALFIIVITIDLNTKFEKSIIKDELKYSAMYTLIIYLPIIFIGLVSTVSIASEGENVAYRLDFLTLILAPIVTTGIVYVRLKYFPTFGFELPKISLSVKKGEMSEDVLIADKVKEEVEESVAIEEKLEAQQTEE